MPTTEKAYSFYYN